MNCVEQTRHWITGHNLIEPASRVIAAVSGGPDSIAMLTILEKLSEDIGFTLAAAYFDHRIRAGTEREKALVTRYCGRLGIETMTGSGDVPSESSASGKGIEETARRLRYRFLEESAERWNADSVALGHNRDDQVETIFHHIIRGSGWKGLTGMPVRRGIFIRPVLSSRREELKRFLIENRIRYVVDKSNTDNSILRNRIRNKLLPLIRKDFNPSIDDSLIRMGENIGEGLDMIMNEPGSSITFKEGPGEVTFPVSEIEGMSDFQIYLNIDRILRDRFGIHSDMEKAHYDAAKKLLRRGRSGSRVEFPHGMVMWKEQGRIRICAGGGDRDRRTGNPQTIPGPGRYSLRSWDLSVQIRKGGRGEASPAETGFSGIVFPVAVRAKRPGDRLVPIGMKGRKKLSDIFIDKKIPLGERDKFPVFEDQKGIFWVPGVVAVERAKVTESSEEIVYIAVSGGILREI